MSVAVRAKEVYKFELRSQLEPTHCGQFVAIEPVSKAFFPGATFIEAALAAKNAFPDRKSFVLRIGHDAAFHIGAATANSIGANAKLVTRGIAEEQAIFVFDEP